MTAPFKAPIWRDGNVLVDAEHELICHTDGASEEELDYIIKAVNHYAEATKNNSRG